MRLGKADESFKMEAERVASAMAGALSGLYAVFERFGFLVKALGER